MSVRGRKVPGFFFSFDGVVVVMVEGGEECVCVVCV